MNCDRKRESGMLTKYSDLGNWMDDGVISREKEHRRIEKQVWRNGIRGDQENRNSVLES